MCFKLQSEGKSKAILSDKLRNTALGKGCAPQQAESAVYSIALAASVCRNRNGWEGRTIPPKGNGHYKNN